MQKMISYFLVLVLPFTYLQTDELYPSGIQLTHINEDSELKQNLNLDNPSLIESFVFLPTNTAYDSFEASKMIMRLDGLPEWVLERAIEKGIYVRLFNENLTDFPTTEHLKGVTPRGYDNLETTWDDVPGIGGSKLVLVKIGHSDKGHGHGSINLELHELAHSLDRFVFDNVRFDFQFLSVWEQETNQLFPGNDYFLLYPEEYFAETFAMYFYTKGSRDELKMKAPLTFNYIQKLMKEN
ncbi:zinc metalloprotease Zmp1 [Bacillus carboniphilus]|uniref:Zinc metalloprotease Zmp1 n=1 Tax=Bacillus carboniphilus TaxID=86663 RepID=A0ABN0WW89_9BACI